MSRLLRDPTHYSKPRKLKKCYFCGKLGHGTKACKIEKLVAPRMKIIIGNYMENYISSNFQCPSCNCNTLEVLGDCTPSLDIKCSNCNKNYEIKSKCLSVDKIPNDLLLHHGQYNKYMERQSKGLDFIIIIYSVNRIMKNIIIREIMHIKHKDIIQRKCISISRNVKTNNSIITIPNKHHSKINKFNIPLNNIISFKRDVNNIIRRLED